eukprot:TRINITY_DN7322_c0_g1_i2.p1 TRINITY_DN7322_c0_g1~~TRINITY_DN7322_c0_g1_i2.p1  ORF type:complete len:103 (+),score=21.96 TRINITY_DN7322_c0_g1_i2:42-350(+)
MPQPSLNGPGGDIDIQTELKADEISGHKPHPRNNGQARKVASKAGKDKGWVGVGHMSASKQKHVHAGHVNVKGADGKQGQDFLDYLKPEKHHAKHGTGCSVC